MALVGLTFPVLPSQPVHSKAHTAQEHLSNRAKRGCVCNAPVSPQLPWRIAAQARRLFSTKALANWSSDAKEESELQNFTAWLKKQGFPDQGVDLKEADDGEVGCFASRDLKAGALAIKVPENFTVTCVDVANHPAISKLAAGRPDLIGLALWMIYEKWLDKKSVWYPYVRTFPSASLSPILWSKIEQETLLKGTSVLGEVKQRCLFLEEEFADIMEMFESQLKEVPQDLFTMEAFKKALSVVLCRALYLPSAELYALVPVGDSVTRSGQSNASFEYSTEEQAVVLKTDKPYKKGQQIFASYGQNRSNSDLLISYGVVDENNSSDFIELEVGLVKGDPLRSLKAQILQQANFQEEQSFPLYLDRFPTQLLSFMRLARIQDSALIAKIVFDKDVVVSEANEYEVLTLLLTECRNRLSNFDNNLDEEAGILKSKDSTPKERVAAKLRYCEQKILNNTMAALRKRLAPIRGLPSKGGTMKDPNSDIKEMFGMMEQVASAPQKFLSNFMKGKDQ